VAIYDGMKWRREVPAAGIDHCIVSFWRW
jgi:hypothetical protein